MSDSTVQTGPVSVAPATPTARVDTKALVAASRGKVLAALQAEFGAIEPTSGDEATSQYRAELAVAMATLGGKAA